MWKLLRAKGLGVKFRRQAIILGWIVDFYCPTQKLVVEVDGWSHEDKKLQDRRRDDVMESKGLSVVRISAQRVFNDVPTVIREIKQHISLPRIATGKAA